jgi:hypothetical protein
MAQSKKLFYNALSIINYEKVQEWKVGALKILTFVYL